MIDDDSAGDRLIGRELIDRRRFRVSDGGMDPDELSQITALCRQQWALGRIGTIPIVPPTGAGAGVGVEYEIEVEIDIRVKQRPR